MKITRVKKKNLPRKKKTMFAGISSCAAKNAFFVFGKIFSVVSLRIFGRIPDFKDNFLMGDFRNLADTV